MRDMEQMRAKVKRVLRSNGGFTLAELMLTILILVMVSVVVANGIPAARNAYEKVVLASNAEVLLSTAVSTLRNELGTAQNVKLGTDEAAQEGTILTYRSMARGAYSRIFVEQGKGIRFQRYYTDSTIDIPVPPSDAEPLISEKTATADLYVTYTSAEYNPETHIITIHNLSVDRRNGSTGLATRESLAIRVLSD